MEKGISLYELLQRVKDAVEGDLKELEWVICEINEFKQNPGGHCYLDLVDFNLDSNTIIAHGRGVIWARNAAMLLPYFKTTTGSPLSQGMRVLLKVQVQYSHLYGLTLNIIDIEPSFTVGEVEVNRQKVISRLSSEGMFGLNAELQMPLLPKRIAIISSKTAAGYRDFIKHLSGNSYGIKFYTKLFQSAMQGDEAPTSIIQALFNIADEMEQGILYDMVVIIRGGGSVLDLAVFDDYQMALSIAQFPLPVLTGIGHDHDYHVADMVAYAHFKTPTAVADYILGLYDSQFELIESLSQRLEVAVGQLTEKKEYEIAAVESRLKGVVGLILEREKSKIEILEYKINSLNPLALLEKGYAIVADHAGRKIERLEDLPRSGVINIFMREGVARVKIEVENIEKYKRRGNEK